MEPLGGRKGHVHGRLDRCTRNSFEALHKPRSRLGHVLIFLVAFFIVYGDNLGVYRTRGREVFMAWFLRVTVAGKGSHAQRQ